MGNNRKEDTMTQLEKVLYTAKSHVTGGRDGAAKTDDGRLVNSKIKGNFRLKGIRSTNPVAVGDRVEIVRNQEGTAFITAICDRLNYIIRKSQNLSKQSHIIAANVDQAFLIVTVNYPQTSTIFIDRFLARLRLTACRRCWCSTRPTYSPTRSAIIRR